MNPGKVRESVFHDQLRDLQDRHLSGTKLTPSVVYAEEFLKLEIKLSAFTCQAGAVPRSCIPGPRANNFYLIE